MLSLSRRKFLQAGAAVAASGVLAVGADATLLEPERPKLVQIEIPLARLPAAWDGVRIAQLSDFHYDDYFSVVPIRKAIAVVNGLQPDLIALTGDFVTVPFLAHRGTKEGTIKAMEPCASLLGQLRARMGIFAVLGNHDALSASDVIIDHLKARGIPVLRDRALALERGGKRLWIAGINDALETDPDLPGTLRGIPPGEPVVLLAHEPDFADWAAQFPIDLQLSGHSHGGQVRLPVLGAPLLPTLGKKYPRGLYRIGSLTLYTNVGIGTVRAPVRLNCPPEITLITLRAAVNSASH